MKSAVKVVFALLLVVIAAELTLLSRFVYPRVRDFSVNATEVLRGRSACSLWQVWKGVQYRGMVGSLGYRLLGQIRRLGSTPDGVQWGTPDGEFWTPYRMNEAGLAVLLAEQENNLYGVGAIQPGDVVLDCGSNIGAFTRKALAAGAALVIAVEPAPDVVRALARTFDAEIRNHRVIVVPKGVWDEEGVMTLRPSEDSVADSFLLVPTNPVGSSETVPLTTIDRIVSELNLVKVDFIKMDIEGAEDRAIKGAQYTIQRYHPRLAIASEHRPDDPTEIPIAVKRLWPGYSVECGPCYKMLYHGRVSPDVIYFR